MVQLREHFASDERGRHSEWLRQRKWFIRARHDQQRREKLADQAEDSMSSIAAATAVASDAQIREFKLKLDRYDTATVNALMENQELLDAARARIEGMLDRAYVMEDGRRVFKTKDGTQVFDEHGAEVSADVLDPALIEDHRPTWEDYSAGLQLEEQLIAERTELLEFQERLDAARSEVDDGEITEADLEELETGILDDMPERVRQHAGLEPQEPDPDLSAPPHETGRLPGLQTRSAEALSPAPAQLQ